MIRRYKEGKHPHYDEAHAKLARQNIALTGKYTRDMAAVLHDVSHKEARIVEIEGLRERAKEPENRDSYYRNGDYHPCRLKALDKQEQAVMERYQEMKEDHRKNGKKPLDEMPPELHNQLLDIHAQIDIYKSEIEELRQQIKADNSQEDALMQDRITREGIFHVKKYDPKTGFLKEVGGLRVIESEPGGELIFDAPGTPFDGCLVWQVEQEFLKAKRSQPPSGFHSREDWPDCSHLRKHKK